MNTLFEVLDFLVLVVLVIQVVRWVAGGLAKSPGALLLTLCVALASAFLATVSLTVFIGLVESASPFGRIIYLAFVVAAALVIAMSRTGKAAT